ncbi:hypothetical protein N7537_010335 [Penicillium hordei]|uniref:Uncharacterized protein n=1 Tax=Penicillium hordei TaxID=40994 RepID=A0AAD6GVK5_9EURO|nr:uncharacterized protein N7537_010335 [Penicillium hordei]KAJ5593431.1 hypothetical protein N7537_010335 [Penicillium hordei]
MTFLVLLVRQHSVAIKAISECRMVYATYKGSVVPYNKNSGFPIVAAQYNGNKTVHCCGTTALENATVGCGNFK